MLLGAGRGDERQESFVAGKNTKQIQLEGQFGDRRLRELPGSVPVGLQDFLYSGEHSLREPVAEGCL